MANNHLPSFSIKVSANGLNALCVELYKRLQEQALLIQGDIQTSADEMIKWWNSHALIKEWVKKLDRQTTKEMLKIELDVSQALCFYSYWANEDLPNFEAVTLYKIISGIDQQLLNQKNKRIK